ncbi:MAG: AraC family transcriptional regulator, partial [Oscillospiraceae bacterium]|nr:AraC family transcriptional regulator [Oscillospiraceae bacterium]
NYTYDSDFFVSRPNGSGDNLLILLKSPAIFNIGGIDIKARENSVILYKKDTPQFYRAHGAEFVCDWFHFSCSDDEIGALENLNIPFDKVLETGGINELSMIIKSMSYEYYSENLYRSDSIGLYMQLFFVKLGEKLCSGEYSSSHYEKLSAIRSRIYSTPQQQWSARELAEETKMSVSYFEHTYKNIFGISLINDVISGRIEHAKFMLSTTDVPIGSIGKMCGYKSDVHFLRQFKSRTGCTPTEYRKRYL